MRRPNFKEILINLFFHNYARGETCTLTEVKLHWILSPDRLLVPAPGQIFLISPPRQIFEAGARFALAYRGFAVPCLGYLATRPHLNSISFFVFYQTLVKIEKRFISLTSITELCYAKRRWRRNLFLQPFQNFLDSSGFGRSFFFPE